MICRFHFLVRVWAVCLATIFGGLLYTPVVSGASFPCDQAGTQTEKMICFDPQVSALDKSMSDTYWQLYKSAADKQALRQSQRDWLRYVRNACASLDCLRDAYQARIRDLASGQPTSLALQGSLADIYSRLESVSKGVTYGAAPSAYEPLTAWLQSRRLLEDTLALARAATHISPDLRLSAQFCGGQINAFYLAGRDAVVVCYELIGTLAQAHQTRVSAQDPSTAEAEGRRLAAAIRYVVLHEIGHSIFKLQENEGLLGREETSADAFAYYVQLAASRNDDEVSDAVWGVFSVFQVLATPAHSYADEHESSEQRLANFACMVIGRSPAFKEHLVRANYLNDARAKLCRKEWNQAGRAIESMASRYGHYAAQ
ncbi:hypothetical protein D3C86_677110 [compost metagenome]|jgi:uncharacterized protein